MTDPIAMLDAVAAPRGGGYFGASGFSPFPSQPAVNGAGNPSPSAASDGASGIQNLDQALQQVGQKLREAGVDVTFSIDQDLNRVIVKVVDSKDGTVLRQMPSEEVLRLARALDAQQGSLLQETV